MKPNKEMNDIKEKRFEEYIELPGCKLNIKAGYGIDFHRKIFEESTFLKLKELGYNVDQFLREISKAIKPILKYFKF